MFRALCCILALSVTMVMCVRMLTSQQTYTALRYFIKGCQNLNQKCQESKQPQPSMQCVFRFKKPDGRSQTYFVYVKKMPKSRMELTRCHIGSEKKNESPGLIIGKSGRYGAGKLRLLSRNGSFKNIGHGPWRAFVFLERSKTLLVGREQNIERHPLQEGMRPTLVSSSTGANDFAVDEGRSFVFFIGTGEDCLIYRMAPSGTNIGCIYKMTSAFNQSGCRLATDAVGKKLFVTLPNTLFFIDYDGKGYHRLLSGVGMYAVDVDEIGRTLYYGKNIINHKRKYSIVRREIVKDRYDLPYNVMIITKQPNKIEVVNKAVFFTVRGDSRLYSFPVPSRRVKPKYTDTGFDSKADMWISLIAFSSGVE